MDRIRLTEPRIRPPPNPRWRYLHDLEFAICAPPKVASRSVFFALVERYYPGRYTYETAKPSAWLHSKEFFELLSNEKVRRISRRVGIVRDPVDRFRSLARHQRDGKAGLPKYVRERSVEALINYVVKNERERPNPHVQAQVCFLRPATELVLFEDLPAWWRGEFSSELPAVNRSKLEVELSDSAIEFVRRWYWRDRNLYDQTKMKGQNLSSQPSHRTP